MSATEDPEHRTVLDLIDHPHRHTLHVVGRLDKDTTGLLLITNDGDWSHRISAPKHHVPKTYLATLAWELTEAGAQAVTRWGAIAWRKGADQTSGGGNFTGQSGTDYDSEGKYHQVKRMFAAVGNRVEALHRERIGGLVLDEELPPGEWRELSVSELVLLTV